MGLSGLFRSLCFPLWLSVESRGSGNRGLGIGIRADNSRFSTVSGLPGGTLASRGGVAKTPYFSWTISCPAPILGDSS